MKLKIFDKEQSYSMGKVNYIDIFIRLTSLIHHYDRRGGAWPLANMSTDHFNGLMSHY